MFRGILPAALDALANIGLRLFAEPSSSATLPALHASSSFSMESIPSFF